MLDECGSQINLTTLYGYAPLGQRLYGTVPRNHGKNLTLICALTHQGLIAPLVFEGAIDGLMFEAYVEQVLVPELVAGQIVVLDNLSVHKSVKVRELIEAKGCELLFLPAYSPEMSPIELAFAQLKHYLKRIGARSREALEKVIGDGLELLLPQQALAYFKHCGYPVPAQ